MAELNTYNALGDRPKAFAIAELLKRAIPNMPFEMTAQPYVVPGNSTESATFRKYQSLDPVNLPTVEGVTPPGQRLTSIDITPKLEQYIGWVGLTDRAIGSHEDDVPGETSRLLAEQFAVSLEMRRALTLRGGTSVFYANGTARTDVNTVLTTTLLNKAVRSMERNNAPLKTEMMKSSVLYGTQATEAGYIAFIHPDLYPVVKSLDGYDSVKDYGVQNSIYPGECGAVGHVRFIKTTLAPIIRDGGGDNTGTAFISASGTKCDVYIIPIMGADAWGSVVMRGNVAGARRNPDGMGVAPIDLIKKMPGTGGSEDPANQRGSIAWKTMMTSVILQQTFMTRLEVAVTEL